MQRIQYPALGHDFRIKLEQWFLLISEDHTKLHQLYDWLIESGVRTEKWKQFYQCYCDADKFITPAYRGGPGAFALSTVKNKEHTASIYVRIAANGRRYQWFAAHTLTYEDSLVVGVQKLQKYKIPFRIKYEITMW